MGGTFRVQEQAGIIPLRVPRAASLGQPRDSTGPVMGEVTDGSDILERTLLVAISKLNWPKH